MKLIKLISIVPILFLSSYSPRQLPQPAFSSPAPEKKLIINKTLIKYINNQAQIDKSEEVVIFADTIIVTEKDTLGDFDLHLYTNYLKVEMNSDITIMPKDSGTEGRNLVLFAKNMSSATIHLPGTPGMVGNTGKNGKDGDPKIVKDEILVSRGTPGEPGEKGKKGGDGGKLMVHSLTNAALLTFNAIGAKGGRGGEGGQGGLTYFRKITKIINPGPNQKIIYGRVESRREPKGTPGPAGEKGKDGVVIKDVVTAQKFDELATQAYLEDWRNIAGNGWRIVFRNSNSIIKNGPIDLNFPDSKVSVLYKPEMISDPVKQNILPETVVKVYPNPFTKSFTLQVITVSTTEETDKVELYSSTDGRLLYQRRLAKRGNTTILLNDIPELRPGLYLLKATVNKKLHTVKMIRH